MDPPAGPCVYIAGAVPGFNFGFFFHFVAVVTLLLF